MAKYLHDFWHPQQATDKIAPYTISKLQQLQREEELPRVSHQKLLHDVSVKWCLP